MTGPDEITFEERKISESRSYHVPRRRSDKVLFKSLSSPQIDALERIAEAYHYETSGLPHARMRFHDAPGGHDYELTPRQMDVVGDFREWEAIVAKPCLYAIINYINGETLGSIEKALRIKNSKAGLYIAAGLEAYCRMKGWIAQKSKQKIRITGRATEITKFIMHYEDELGRLVHVVSK